MTPARAHGRDALRAACSASRARATRWRRPSCATAREIAVELRAAARTRCTRPTAASCPSSRRATTCARSRQVVERALARGGRRRRTTLDGVAVTAGPGLVGSLLVGLCVRQGARVSRSACRWSACTTVAGHLASAELADAALRPPYLGLVVSGGHTALYRIEAEAPPALLGETRDDAVGRGVRQGRGAARARRIPGGPAVARAAEQRRRRERVALPAPAARRRRASTSPTAGSRPPSRSRSSGARGARSERATRRRRGVVRAAAIEVLVARARRALRARGARPARRGRRRRGQRAPARASSARRGARGRLRALSFPPRALCTDNAAMIAAAGARLLARGEHHGARAERVLARAARRRAVERPSVSAAARSASCSRATGSRARRDLGQNFLVDARVAAERSSTLRRVGAGRRGDRDRHRARHPDARARARARARRHDRGRRRPRARAARRGAAAGERRAASTPTRSTLDWRAARAPSAPRARGREPALRDLGAAAAPPARPARSCSRTGR